MKTMLYIPSSGRANRLVTLRSLPLNWMKKTSLVVAKKEFDDYKNLPVHVTTHPNLFGLGRIRHFICDKSACDIVVLLDDDVVFYTRRNGKLFNATPEEVGNALDLLVKWVTYETDLGQAALSLSMLNHHKTEDFYTNEKCGPCTAIRMSAYRKLKNKFNSTPLLQSDNGITLSFLTSGYKVKVSYKYAYKNVPPLPEHRDTGCSGYRSSETEMDACNILQKLYGPYVTIKHQESDNPSKYTLYNRATRPLIRWKKAYEDAIKH